MKRATVHFYIFCLILTACSKNGGDDPVQDGPAPAKPVLSLPANNSACISGQPANGFTSAVILQWQQAEDAVSYDLVITNLTLGGQFKTTVTGTSYEAAMSVNNGYSWYVVAKSAAGNKTTQSDSWKFYLAGKPQDSYAPFAATAITPVNNSIVSTGVNTTTSVTLEWKSDDIDNDIERYAVYFDQVDATTLITPAQTATTLTRTVTEGKTYFWKVVTTDRAGNSSESSIFMFKVN